MMKCLAQVSMEWSLVQILVVVATIQTSVWSSYEDVLALKTVVEKVSLKLANMQGLVGPKPLGNPFLIGEREWG